MLDIEIANSFDLDFEIYSTVTNKFKNYSDNIEPSIKSNDIFKEYENYVKMTQEVFYELNRLLNECNSQRMNFRVLLIKMSKDKLLVDKFFQDEGETLILKRLSLQEELKNKMIDNYIDKVIQSEKDKNKIEEETSILKNQLKISSKYMNDIKVNKNNYINEDKVLKKMLNLDFISNNSDNFNIISQSPIQTPSGLKSFSQNINKLQNTKKIINSPNKNKLSLINNTKNVNFDLSNLETERNKNKEDIIKLKRYSKSIDFDNSNDYFNYHTKQDYSNLNNLEKKYSNNVNGINFNNEYNETEPVDVSDYKNNSMISYNNSISEKKQSRSKIDLKFGQMPQCKLNYNNVTMDKSKMKNNSVLISSNIKKGSLKSIIPNNKDLANGNVNVNSSFFKSDKSQLLNINSSRSKMSLNSLISNKKGK